MSLTSPRNTKGGNKKTAPSPHNAQGSKFITKPGGNVPIVKKKVSTGSRRGS